ncbi:unnamed protein product [Symbiodinium natans]|uniref:Uncharacterized protein n=1 Tax=Symbiodinium natans TaxID=878477 RepID=A0A812RI51_9DINO|nr:unnamed protein product [Symbiodinium natans]
MPGQPSAYARALNDIRSYDFTPVSTPLISKQDDANGCVEDLPLKNVEGRYLAKFVVDMITDVKFSAVDFEGLEERMLQNQYDQLPPPFCPKVEICAPFKMQLAIIKTSITDCVILKCYTFENKTNIRTVEDIAYGTLKMIDFTPNFRAGPLAIQLMLKEMSHWMAYYTQISPKPPKEPKPKQETDDLQNGFAYIKSNGPRTNMGNQQIEWAEIETKRAESPLHGWSAGLVKECLRGLTSGNVYAKTVEKFYLTLHDLSGWLLDEVLVHLLGELKAKTLVFLGLAEKGKTPAAEAIAMAVSEYHLLRDNLDPTIRPGFRICASLDQLRGESGEKHRPDILDDPDMNTLPIPKLKSFLDSTLLECHTVERWTAARFVQHQLRVVCDNKVDENAEPDDTCDTTTSFEIFFEMIKPAFNEKASRQDIMACLKRAHFVVNMNHAVFFRKAGTSKGPVTRVPYINGNKDFLSPVGQKVIDDMRQGIPDQPADWAQKRQWSHDLMSMLTETQQKPARTRVVFEANLFTESSQRYNEIKPDLPFSGRICPNFLCSEDTLSMPAKSTSVASMAPSSSAAPSPSGMAPSLSAAPSPSGIMTKVKEECVEGEGSFAMMLSNPDAIGVIDLDPTPPSPSHKRMRGSDEMDYDSDDHMPLAGEDPEE